MLDIFERNSRFERFYFQMMSHTNLAPQATFRDRSIERFSFENFEKLFSRTSADFEISKLEIEGFWEFQVPFLGSGTDIILGHENGHFYVRLRTVSYLDGNGHQNVRLRAFPFP